MEDLELTLNHKAMWLLQEGRLRLIDCACKCPLGEVINDGDEVECIECGEMTLPVEIVK